MLVLSRRVNESIIIGDDIKVTVLGVRGEKGGVVRIKLGFDAPHEVPINREEIYQKNQTQKASQKLET